MRKKNWIIESGWEDKDGVIFPVAPNLSEMSDTYLNFIEEIKAEIQKQRISVVLNANSSMICLYWNIGKAIIKKQEKEGWIQETYRPHG